MRMGRVAPISFSTPRPGESRCRGSIMPTLIETARTISPALSLLSCVALATPARAASMGPGDIRVLDFGVTNAYETVTGDVNSAGIVIGAANSRSDLSVPAKAFLDPG